MSEAIKELWAILVDAMATGDLGGHLKAWLRVIRGQVDAGDLIAPAGEGQ